MGMDADVIAIGRFSKAIAPYLGYPLYSYDDTPEGATVITSLLECCTTYQSGELAEALGIDPWKFEQAHFDANLVAEEVLQDAIGRDTCGRWEVERFLELRTAGFQFYYRPNG